MSGDVAWKENRKKQVEDMAAMASNILSVEKKKKCAACFEKVLMIAETVLNCISYHYAINKKH